MTINDLRDAIVTYLGASGVNGAVAAYRTAVDQKELAVPVVSVIPSAVSTTRASRSTIRKEISVDIAYRVSVRNDSVSEIDEHQLAAEQLEELFRPGEVISTGCPPVLTASRSPIWSQEHLQEFSVFTSVIRVTFLDVVSG